MNIPKKIFSLSFLLPVLITLTGCDKNTSGPEPDNPFDSVSDSLSTLVVTFEDDTGNLLDYNEIFGLLKQFNTLR